METETLPDTILSDDFVLLGLEARRITKRLKTQLHAPEKAGHPKAPGESLGRETPNAGNFAGTMQLPTKRGSKAITRPRKGKGRREP